MTTNEFEVPVRGTTPPKKLAGMVRARYREDPDIKVRLTAIGVSAVNQCVKALVELNKLMVASGYLIQMFPTMEDRDIPDRNNPDGPAVQRTVTVFNLRKSAVGG